MTSPQHAAPGQTFDSFADFYRNSAYAAFPQEHRTTGSFGATMFRAQHEPLDLIDPPVPEYVFLWDLKGGGCLDIDMGDGIKTTEQVPSNTLHVVPPMTSVYFSVDYSHELTGAALPSVFVDALLEEHKLGPNVFSSFYSRPKSVPRPLALMDAMWRHSNTLGPTANLYLDGVTMQFLALVADHASMSPLAPERPEDDRIAHAIDYIEAHYGEALTIAELAAIACLSPGHFSRTFKATTGEPVWTYVQRRRCERAKEMLLTTQLPIAEIAYRCGFASQSHFTTTFSHQFGVTPGLARNGSIQ
ncbi:helix-turn-helix domain-containing protein [uncultured Roseobacter sp.]|uniref:helix-turn-helix domain-containing protein n=1 Tax=uncultured Roseobacter sp. TaxID=114847 RepID=UPI002624E2ED|nr:AraC family transcriptional regulator [uncultured Roseobacter sp.]